MPVPYLTLMVNLIYYLLVEKTPTWGAHRLSLLILRTKKQLLVLVQINTADWVPVQS